jgi:hypothetical protein
MLTLSSVNATPLTPCFIGFNEGGPMEIAREYQVIFVVVCGKFFFFLFANHVFGIMSCDLTSSAAV